LFENLIGQQKFVERISLEVNKNFLPSALLFSGEHCSGKLTAALELARVLSCKKSGAWNCRCLSCNEHRRLAHNQTLMLGKRDFIPEILASLSFLERSEDSLIPRLMVIRAVNKLVSRYNPVFTDSMDKVMKKTSSTLESIAQSMIPLYPTDKMVPFYTKKWADSLIKSAKKLQDELPETISVNLIRAINHWSRVSGHDSRTVIIEGADQLNQSSSNALLKILEEPPTGLTGFTPLRIEALPNNKM